MAICTVTMRLLTYNAATFNGSHNLFRTVLSTDGYFSYRGPTFSFLIGDNDNWDKICFSIQFLEGSEEELIIQWKLCSLFKSQNFDFQSEAKPNQDKVKQSKTAKWSDIVQSCLFPSTSDELLVISTQPFYLESPLVIVSNEAKNISPSIEYFKYLLLMGFHLSRAFCLWVAFNGLTFRIDFHNKSGCFDVNYQ